MLNGIQSQKKLTPSANARLGTDIGSSTTCSTSRRPHIWVRVVIQATASPSIVAAVAAMTVINRLLTTVARTSSDCHRYATLADVNRPDHVKVEKAAAVMMTIGPMTVSVR